MDFVWHNLHPHLTPWEEYIQQAVANVLHQQVKKSVSGQMCNYHKRDTELQHHSAVAGGISSCHLLQKEHLSHECFVWIRFLNKNCDIGLIFRRYFGVFDMGCMSYVSKVSISAKGDVGWPAPLRRNCSARSQENNGKKTECQFTCLLYRKCFASLLFQKFENSRISASQAE